MTDSDNTKVIKLKEGNYPTWASEVSEQSMFGELSLVKKKHPQKRLGLNTWPGLTSLCEGQWGQPDTSAVSTKSIKWLWSSEYMPDTSAVSTKSKDTHCTAVAL